MQKIPCAVIKDLLPSYVDGLTSAETNELIQEHLAECADCSAILAAMQEATAAAPEERKEIARKGQAAAVESKRRNRNIRKALQAWLEGDSGAKGKDGEMLSGTDLMVAVAVKEMARGNPKFWELIRDTSGQKPVEQIMVAEVDPAVIDEIEKAVLEE
jgi:anti-sigma factor RsiW